jgi:galactokinase
VAGHALLIDCRSLEVSPVPLPAGVAVIVLDTGTRRQVGASAYEDRRRACEQASAFLGASTLRDVSLRDLAGAAGGLPESTLRRARHVVTENERTLQAAQALRRGDAIEVGALMNASHASMRDDFEISTRELDAIVECSLARGCLGARLTGAGFGGCAVALVWMNQAAEFTAQVGQDYRAATGREARVYVCQAAAGAEVVPAPGVGAASP